MYNANPHPTKSHVSEYHTIQQFIISWDIFGDPTFFFCPLKCFAHFVRHVCDTVSKKAKGATSSYAQQFEGAEHISAKASTDRLQHKI